VVPDRAEPWRHQQFIAVSTERDRPESLWLAVAGRVPLPSTALTTEDEKRTGAPGAAAWRWFRRLIVPA
jgi:hypothetical protein